MRRLHLGLAYHRTQSGGGNRPALARTQYKVEDIILSPSQIFHHYVPLGAAC